MQIDGHISVEVHLTEDPDLIMNMIAAIFPDVEWKNTLISRGERYLNGEFHDISVLRDLLAEQRIRDTAREVFLSSEKDGKRISFSLAKNALSRGRINFAIGQQPLGDIFIVIEADNIDEIIDYLTEKE